MRSSTIAVFEFLHDFVEVGFVFGLAGVGGELVIGLEAQAFGVDIGGWDVGIDGQFEFELGWGFDLVALEFGYGFADHAQVEVEADSGDVARLLSPEKVAGATDFKVFQGHLHAGAEFVVGGDGGEAVVGGFGEGLAWVIEEVGIGALSGATHAASNLVQLAEAKVLGSVDNQCVGIWNIDAGLDDGGGNQHVEFLLPEIHHDLFELTFVHLAVRHGNACLGHEFL